VIAWCFVEWNSKPLLLTVGEIKMNMHDNNYRYFGIHADFYTAEKNVDFRVASNPYLLQSVKALDSEFTQQRFTYTTVKNSNISFVSFWYDGQ